MTAAPVISPMRNRIRDYDWGSTSALALLQARTPSGGPEAELWMGAHPGAPSELVLDDGSALPLPDAIRADPQSLLGPDVVARFGPRLPYMLKVLAIERPLSVQVHPDADRARAAYREDGSSPYTDPFHKPEMLVALEPIEALFGFRHAAQAAELIGRLRCPRLQSLVDDLAGDGEEPARLHAALAVLVRWPMEDRAALVAEIAAAVVALHEAGEADYPDVYGWLDRLIGLHPADPMVLAPLLLDLIRLSPGQSVFVPAGVPHAYLSGLGVEILAGSDNVLRAGLTSKAIAVDELLAVIDTRPLTPTAAPTTTLSEHEIAWRPPVPDFQLTRVEVPGADPVPGDPSVTGPQIVLCIRGKVQVAAGSRSVVLTPGFSAFVPASAGPLTFSGEGELFRAAPGVLTGGE